METVLGVDSAATNGRAERGDHRVEILRLDSVRSHADVAGHFFNVEILAGLEAGQRGNCGHPRSKIEARQFRAVQAHCASGDQFADRPGREEIGATATRSEGAPLWKI